MCRLVKLRYIGMYLRRYYEEGQGCPIGLLSVESSTLVERLTVSCCGLCVCVFPAGFYARETETVFAD